MNSQFSNALSVAEYFSGKLDKPAENYAGYMSAKALDDFSLQLVNYRNQKGLNQTGLARELNISQPMVSQYESGTNNITVKRLCEICEMIGVRVQISFEAADSPITQDQSEFSSKKSDDLESLTGQNKRRKA